MSLFLIVSLALIISISAVTVSYAFEALHRLLLDKPLDTRNIDLNAGIVGIKVVRLPVLKPIPVLVSLMLHSIIPLCALGFPAQLPVD